MMRWFTVLGPLKRRVFEKNHRKIPLGVSSWEEVWSVVNARLKVTWLLYLTQVFAYGLGSLTPVLNPKRKAQTILIDRYPEIHS